MLVDIHTHNNSSEYIFQIRNISLSDDFLDIEKAGFFSMGIHPLKINEYNDNQLNLLNKYATNLQVVAIGECGLDKRLVVNIEKQIDLFEKHIIISEETKKPLIIHCVGYFNELIAVRKKINPIQKWIIHGFRGKPQLAQQLLKTGMALSFGEKFNAESVKIVPVSELFIETDESKIPLAEIYKRIALLKGCNISALNAGFNLMKGLILK